MNNIKTIELSPLVDSSNSSGELAVNEDEYGIRRSSPLRRGGKQPWLKLLQPQPAILFCLAILILIIVIVVTVEIAGGMFFSFTDVRTKDPKYFSDQRLEGHPDLNRVAKYGRTCDVEQDDIMDKRRSPVDYDETRMFSILHDTRIVPDTYVASLAKQAIALGFHRFEYITGSTRHYTSSQCVQTSLDCFFSHKVEPHDGDQSTVKCWCVSINFQSGKVSYLAKTGILDEHNKTVDNWGNNYYGNIQMEINLIQVAVLEFRPYLPKKGIVYLLVNAWDEPKMFVPTDNVEELKRLPALAEGHPGHDFYDYDRKGWFSFDGSFPDPSQTLGKNVCQRFPILSWSVNPLHMFDILAPHKHGGDCRQGVLEPDIANIPWEEKTRTLSFHGNLGACDASDGHNQRERACGIVNQYKNEIQTKFNIKVDFNLEWETPSQTAKSKFIILFDGCVAAFRSTWYLASGSVILASGLHVDYRSAMMVPYVHYIPFSPMDKSFDGFMDALALVANDDDYARQIGENARRLGQTLSMMRREGGGEGDDQYYSDGGNNWDKIYMGQVLQYYSNRYTFTEDHDANKYKFTTDKSCETASDPNNPPDTPIKAMALNDQCLNETYACSDVVQDGFLHDPNVKFVNLPQ